MFCFRFEQFYINGVQIRFVHIPDSINIMKTIEAQLKTIDSVRNKTKFEKRKKNMQFKRKAQQKFEEMKMKLQQSKEEQS